MLVIITDIVAKLQICDCWSFSDSQIGKVDCGNALPDSILGWKCLCPGSMPPEGQVPSEAEEIARRAAASAAAKLIPPNLTILSLS